MSLDAGKGTSKSSYSDTSTTSLDPRFASAIYGNLDRAKGLADSPFQGFTGSRVAGLTGLEREGLGQSAAVARSNVSGDHLAASLNGFNGLSYFQPQNIDASTYNPITGTAAQINRGDIRDVSGAPTSAADIARFTDPWEDEVVATTAADLALQGRIADQYAKSVGNGQWGGTGEAVRRTLSSEASGRTLASTLAQLRSTGFQTATQAAQADKLRGLQADMANQGMDWSVGSRNADFTQDMEKTNLGYGNQAGRDNAMSEQEARMANQRAAMEAAGIRLGANQSQFDAAQTLRGNAYDDASALVNAGAYERAITQGGLDADYEDWALGYEDPYRKWELLNQTMGLVPQTGTTTSSGKSKQKTTKIGASIGAGWSPAKGFSIGG
ncbi:hypothetical protein [Caulobacter sp. NIBR2454]|uniref:hypothetical protein n=1 Tax=Caulobacter sp. NIBR2454 TaxID=3015996 RepID=UPI0022B6EA78|nr:hypothetical protein [Caulobacter sp. NIBR2454]